MSSTVRYKIATMNLPNDDFIRLTANLVHTAKIGNGKTTPISRIWQLYADDGTLLLEIHPDWTEVDEELGR